MSNNLEDIILEKVKMKVSVLNLKKEICTNIHTNNEKSKKYNLKIRTIAIACASLVLISGIAIANNTRKLQKNFVNQVKYIDVGNIGVNVELQDLLMDDLNVNMKFKIQFDEKINDILDFDTIHEVTLQDLIIVDDENRIIYSGFDKERFDTYCAEHNLKFEYGKFNDNYLNRGIEVSPYYFKEQNMIETNYNIYSEHPDCMPKSKKLYVSFKTIILGTCFIKNDILYETERYVFNGNWSFTLDV